MQLCRRGAMFYTARLRNVFAHRDLVVGEKYRLCWHWFRGREEHDQDCRSSTPSFLASFTGFSRTRFNSLASVGKLMFFGCTVVSTMTRARSPGFSAPLLVAFGRPYYQAKVDYGLGSSVEHFAGEPRRVLGSAPRSTGCLAR